MATDVDVQYFSHLNGLILGNNWGDLIRLLDKALVTGIDFTQITAASIDAQGDVHITLYSTHSAMLFQVVELSGFAPASLNQKYRIKGVPNATQLILKPGADIVERLINATGTGKLASLGYEIIFRDTNDVKRVYRAKNPTVQHPYIRVDETISDGANSYTSTYAKYAMVGLLENMDHIDDYENPNVLQLPFDPENPAKNWKITGTNTAVVRGWSKWYFAGGDYESSSVSTANRSFTLCGSVEAFYILNSIDLSGGRKFLNGCGLFNSALDTEIIPNWLLISSLYQNAAATCAVATNNRSGQYSGSYPLFNAKEQSVLHIPYFSTVNRISAQTKAYPILSDFSSGFSDIYSSNNLSGLEIPLVDNEKYLRGSLKHIFYAGNNKSSALETTMILAENSMYIWDSANRSTNAATVGGLYFYLGEIE